jgi:hypothetical protein
MGTSVSPWLWVHAPLAPTPEFFALVAGPHFTYSSPRRRLPCASINEGSNKARYMTWRGTSAGP